MEKDRVLVVGAAGVSGRAAALLLARLGHTVVCSDLKLIDYADGQRILSHRPPRQDAALIADEKISRIVTAPGVPLTSDLFRAARARGIPFQGENDLGFVTLRKHSQAPPVFLGITGTDGKSTTTALCVHLINSATNTPAVAAGNFGEPLCSHAMHLLENDLDPAVPRVYVVECSSFQLELVDRFHPRIGMLLNIADDHLDRYGSRDEYLAAKMNLAANMTEDDLFLAPGELLRSLPNQSVRARELPALADFAPQNPILYRGQPLASWSDYSRTARHDQLNLLFALAALEELEDSRALSVDPAGLKAALGSFSGLPHRMEIIANAGGIEFINDSKATTVQAVSAALAGLSSRPVALLLGGHYKGGSFRELVRLMHPRSRFFPFGEAGHEIARAVSASEAFPDLQKAFRAAVEYAENIIEEIESSVVVLLSPGCASYDQYRSYIERGDHFRELTHVCNSNRNT